MIENEIVLRKTPTNNEREELDTMIFGWKTGGSRPLPARMLAERNRLAEIGMIARKSKFKQTRSSHFDDVAQCENTEDTP
jgi:hypothetical protein